MSSIERIVKHIERRANERDEYRLNEKLKGEREQMIREAPAKKMVELWCDKCRKDLTAPCRKVVTLNWNRTEPVAFYRGKCPKGHIVTRLITDKLRDPYYNRSAIMRFQRRQHAKDTLQPGQYGFQTLYGNRGVI